VRQASVLACEGSVSPQIRRNPKKGRKEGRKEERKKRKKERKKKKDMVSPHKISPMHP